MQAAGFLVSDAVAELWRATRDRHGFAGFAEQAAPQLIRWEAAHGWTRVGEGSVAQKETTLAQVVAGMLAVPDHWIGFATEYLNALDAVADQGSGKRRWYWSADRERRERARALAEWHGILLDRLYGSETEGLLDRMAGHPALAGPELTFLQARLAELHGEDEQVRDLTYQCLQTLAGHPGFHHFAHRVEAPLPPRAQTSPAAHPR